MLYLCVYLSSCVMFGDNYLNWPPTVAGPVALGAVHPFPLFSQSVFLLICLVLFVTRRG
jgi:hypothetical protein